MKINILPISSCLHDKNLIDKQTQELISILKQHQYKVEISSLDNFYQADLSLILVQSGGSENLFLKYYPSLKKPFYLLTFSNNNSLAASMEILSFIRNENKEGEILHGDYHYLLNRISQLLKAKNDDLINLGVVGKPSDWLISSNVDYQKLLTLYKINLIDLPIKELENNYHLIKESVSSSFKDFNRDELNKTEKVYLALKKMVYDYHLSGLTVRCFDLLTSLKTTSCLALSKLNQEGIVSSCEGDIPTLVSMLIVKKLTGLSSFQANPSKIDVKNNTMIFAHCTLPLDMVTSYKLMTHYESKIGVAVKGELRENQEITIFKLSSNLEEYYVAKGKIIRNLNYENLCRTQIEIQVDDVNYFLTHPFGNHHLIIYGDHVDKINNYFSKILNKKD